jgi:DNA gyrase subunit A
MMITTEGIIIQFAVKDISVIGRNTSGVKLMNIDKDSDVSIASIAKVRSKPEEAVTDSETDTENEVDTQAESNTETVEDTKTNIDIILEAAEKSANMEGEVEDNDLEEASGDESVSSENE